MKKIFYVLASILAATFALCSPASATSKPSVLLISIDAMGPNLISKADSHGLEIPNLRKFLKEGTSAEGVKGVLPTLTYPSHASIITGVYPEKHGIINNVFFDPKNTNKGAWLWWADWEVDDLWAAATRGGYQTASLFWPVSVDAKADYNIPEYWRTGTSVDDKFLDSFSSPRGIVKEVREALGADRICTWAFDVREDSQNTDAALYILEKKMAPSIEEKPVFMSMYYASLDTNSHHRGWDSDEAMETLESIDKMVGNLTARFEKLTKGNCVIAVVSDHGMISIDTVVNINTVFASEGLISLDDNGKVKDWKVFALDGHGSAYIKLKDPEDKVTFKQVRKIIKDLAADKYNGIAQVYDRKDLKTMQAYPGADFVLGAADGFRFGSTASGPLLSSPKPRPAGYWSTHGFAPDNPKIYSSLLIKGKDIPKGKKLGIVNLVDIAPTLAEIMGFKLETAQGKALLSK